MRVTFENTAWDDFLEWQNIDKRTAQKIVELIKERKRSPQEGKGKPEPLRHEMAGFWSRQIDKKHRLVYRVEADNILIVKCKGHYDDR